MMNFYIVSDNQDLFFIDGVAKIYETLEDGKDALEFMKGDDEYGYDLHLYKLSCNFKFEKIE